MGNEDSNSIPASNKNFIGDDGLIHNIYVGDQNASTLRKAERELYELSQKLREKGQRVLIYTDVSKIGKITLSARITGLQVMRNLDFDKVAICGPLSLEKTIVNVISQAAGKYFKVKYFAKEEYAKEWLQEKYV